MLQSQRSFLGDKSVPWDTGCARRFLLISDEQKKILESIPGWSVEETKQTKNPIFDSEKSSKISEQLPPTQIAGTGHTDRQTCNPLILNLNPITKESDGFNNELPPKENSMKKTTFMQSISLYANKVVNMFSRRRSNSLSDIDYAKFDNGLTRSKSETNLAEDDYKTFRNSSAEITCEKLDTRILNHPFLNGSETLVFPTTDGAASLEDLLSKRVELLKKRFSLPKESGSLLAIEEVGSRINVSTEQETTKKSLVPEKNSLLLRVEEIRRKTNFGAAEEETEESGLSKGLVPPKNNLPKDLAPEENSLFKGLVSDKNSLSKGFSPPKNSLLLLAEEIRNEITFENTVSKSETNMVSITENQGLETQQSACLPGLVFDNNLKSSSNVLFDETDKVCIETVESHNSIENVSEAPLLTITNSNNDYVSKTIVSDIENSHFNSNTLSKIIVSDTENLHSHSDNDYSSKSMQNISEVPATEVCNENETNSIILHDEDSLPSIESILLTKIQENQIQILKSVTSIDVSQKCGKTTEETDQSGGITPSKGSLDEKVTEHHDAEKPSMLLLKNDYFLKTIAADTENSHDKSNNDFFSKIIVADTENSHFNSNNLLKIIVDDTENLHSNCAIETYNSASAKLGGKRKRLSKDNRNFSNTDKPFVVVADTKVVADTENSDSNCVLENYSNAMNNSASGKLGGKRKRQGKDNDKPRKKSLVESPVIIQFTANEVNNMIQLMKVFQKKI